MVIGAGNTVLYAENFISSSKNIPSLYLEQSIEMYTAAEFSTFTRKQRSSYMTEVCFDFIETYKIKSEETGSPVYAEFSDFIKEKYATSGNASTQSMRQAISAILDAAETRPDEVAVNIFIGEALQKFKEHRVKTSNP
jgi:hypothetical protein